MTRSRAAIRMDTTVQPKSEFPPGRLAYSVQETAGMLGVCEKSVRRLILRGLIRPSRALRHILIPRTEIERFLRETQESAWLANDSAPERAAAARSS